MNQTIEKDNMKILVLNGSPKKEKSDTMCITRAFIDGMNEVLSNDVNTVHIIDKNIKYCAGCFTCMRNGGKCIHTDDMQEILNEILASDLLILSFPLYCYGMPAPLKNVMDRILPLTSMKMQKTEDQRYTHITQADVTRLKYMMICGCGFPNSKQNFEPAVAQFNLMFRSDNTVITIPESPMFNAPEASSVTIPRLELIKKAGKEYAVSGSVSKELLSEITSPMIPEQIYAQIINGS